MPSTTPDQAYGAQLIILFAPDDAIYASTKTLIRGFNQLKWVDQGKKINIFSVVLDRRRLDMRPEDAGAEDQEEFDAFKDKLAATGGLGRIYLTGHGDWASQTLAGVNAKWVADALKPRIPPVHVISVLGCGLGRDRSSDSTLMSSSMDSFGSKLHFLLKGYCEEVSARVLDLAVSFEPGAVGRKATGTYNAQTKMLNDPMLHRKASKLKFVWERDRQVRQWAIYPDEVVT
jgi:hypothetical protein